MAGELLPLTECDFKALCALSSNLWVIIIIQRYNLKSKKYYITVLKKQKVLHKDMMITSNPELGRHIASNPRWCLLTVQMQLHNNNNFGFKINNFGEEAL